MGQGMKFPSYCQFPRLPLSPYMVKNFKISFFRAKDTNPVCKIVCLFLHDIEYSNFTEFNATEKTI